jgi:hypothetical protein
MFIVVNFRKNFKEKFRVHSYFDLIGVINCKYGWKNRDSSRFGRNQILA